MATRLRQVPVAPAAKDSAPATYFSALTPTRCPHNRRGRLVRGAWFRDRLAIVVNASPSAIFQAFYEQHVAHQEVRREIPCLRLLLADVCDFVGPRPCRHWRIGRNARNHTGE